MTYRDTELSCTSTYAAKDKNGRTVTLPSMFPSCPREPMPTRSTPKLSYIRDFSPYLYDFARDPDDTSKPYSGYLARGTKGDPTQTFAAIGNAPEGVTRQKGCVNQINLSGITDPKERAKAIRLQLDNCANQFILNSAIYPFHKAGSILTCGTDANPTQRCQQEDMCQPLRMTNDPKQEYLAATYVEAAWKKLLNDPNYRRTPGALKEPHLPTGLKLDNPIALPADLSSLRINALAATPYEEIIDPSHPFSPRWDFRWNERERYSPMTREYMSKYHDNSKAVYCAGNRADTGEKKDYRVDVLEFRREKFETGLNNRIGYNNACYQDKGNQTVAMMNYPVVGVPNPQFVSMVQGAYCYKVVRPPIPAVLPYYQGYAGEAQRLPCWECYGLDGKVDDSSESQYPPCTTRYDGQDQSIENSQGASPIFPGARNGMKRKAICTTNPFQSGKSMSVLCKDLRAPYTPINKLKMRYHNPEGDEAAIVLKNGVAEGLSFTDYFGGKSKEEPAHMPYPRLWDTGRSIQKNTSTDQDPMDTEGQYTVIVGVGREAKPGQDDDQRCLYGGWGGDVSVGGFSFAQNDPITSWTELKLYQAYTTRETGIVCLGRYEKAFKHRSAENQLLVAGGAVRTGIVQTQCDRDSEGRIVPGSCESKEVGEGASQANRDWSNMQYIQDSMPLAWRGYMGDPVAAQSFGKLGAGGGFITGLDNAQCGDIILMPTGGGRNGDAASRGLPKLARVACDAGARSETAASGVRATPEGGKFIKVEEPDNGKWPDTCGTTNVLGEMKTRLLYKPGGMRKEILATVERLNWTKSCSDTGLSECEMEPWNELQIYRPLNDVRDGADEAGGAP